MWLLASIAAGVPLLGAAGAGTRIVDAAKDGNFAAVKALIAQKADVNVAEADGMTALHWAVRANDLPTVQALIRAVLGPAPVAQGPIRVARGLFRRRGAGSCGGWFRCRRSASCRGWFRCRGAASCGAWLRGRRIVGTIHVVGRRRGAPHRRAHEQHSRQAPHHTPSSARLALTYGVRGHTPAARHLSNFRAVPVARGRRARSL